MGRSAGDIAATDVDIDAYSHIGGDSYPNYYRDADQYGDRSPHRYADADDCPNKDTNADGYVDTHNYPHSFIHTGPASGRGIARL